MKLASIYYQLLSVAFISTCAEADVTSVKKENRLEKAAWYRALRQIKTPRSESHEDNQQRELSLLLTDPRTEEVKSDKARGCDQLIRDGPLPVVLISMGRSGSSAIWETMAVLTGQGSQPIELPGENLEETAVFFESLANRGDSSGRWMFKYFYENQKERIKRDQSEGIVGFKWKPYPSFFSEAAQKSLGAIAKSCPQIKVVRSRRNALDVYLSLEKHSNDSIDRIPAHCKPDDFKCIEKHYARSTGMNVSVPKMLSRMKAFVRLEDQVDENLDALGIPHVDVSYELLFSDDENVVVDEWDRVFKFLEIGPTKGNGLSAELIRNAPGMAVTSTHSHKEMIANYEEVRSALSNTPFESLLN